MTLDRDALEAVARVATPGPWHQGAHYIGAGGEPYDPEAVVGQASILCDAEHIAAFDPPTVRALITRLREAESRLREAEAVIEKVREIVGPPKPLELGKSMMRSFDRMIGDLRRTLATYKPTNNESEDEK